MATALQQAYQGLEGKVKEKTAHLAQQNERLEEHVPVKNET